MKEVIFRIGQKPPNWDLLVKTFNVKWENTVVTFGNNVYSEKPISNDLIAHELVHVKQQGKNPNLWWKKYIADKAFRLDQEVEAHIAQMKDIKKHSGKDRNYIAVARARLASYLSSSMYGNCISYDEAYNELR